VLPGALRSLHQAVLRHFLTNGEPPDRGWMQQQARAFGLDPGSAIRQLTAADLVRVGGDGVALVAYPFSGVPSGHRVQLAGGPAVWAMGAIDALGIPRMADRDATIIATDACTGDEVRSSIRATGQGKRDGVVPASWSRMCFPGGLLNPA
jgi:Alkylmercury lyase